MQRRSLTYRQSGGTIRAVPLFAILLLGSAALAQGTRPASQRVFYVDGQLKIDASDATLGQILFDVAALTGVKIDVPDGVGSVRIPSVTVGPGTAREVLASLLSDSRCDFIIQAADTDPTRIQNVVIIARDKRGSTPGPEVAARSFGSATAASAAPADPEPAPAPEQANASIPQPDPPPPPDAASDDSMRQKLGMTDGYTFPKTSPVSPPAALNQQTISQQLQQMYQQRMQMNPQTSAATPATPAAKPASP